MPKKSSTVECVRCPKCGDVLPPNDDPSWEAVKQWRAIPGHEGYLANAKGQIWSITKHRILKGALLRDKKHRREQVYRVVCLHVGGVQLTIPVHRLVALAFLGAPQDGQTLVRHLNGDGVDNRADNLAWGGPKENSEDARRHGTLPQGELGTSVLSVMDVRAIRRMLQDGLSHAEIGRTSGVSGGVVSDVASGASWSHLPLIEGEAATNKPSGVRRGSENRASKLVEDDIRIIRSEYASGNKTQVELARQFGVIQSTISQVILRKVWRHVE